MARPKGSKNKTRTVKAAVDYAAVVAEKTAEKEKIESEVASLTANLDDLKTQLKVKKAELKAATNELLFHLAPAVWADMFTCTHIALLEFGKDFLSRHTAGQQLLQHIFCFAFLCFFCCLCFGGSFFIFGFGKTQGKHEQDPYRKSCR